MSLRRSCILIFLAHNLSISLGIFFHVTEGEKKCFVEEVPKDTLIQGKYKIEYYNQETSGFVPAGKDIGMDVMVKDPQDTILLSRAYSATGRFAFTSPDGGEHVICIHSTNTQMLGTLKLRVYLTLSTGEHTVNYDAVSKKEKLNELETRVRKLIDQVQAITKEQEYQRTREERFRVTSDNTSLHLLVWSLLQLITLVCLGIWQAKHLESFFRKKKIV